MNALQNALREQTTALRNQDLTHTTALQRLEQRLQGYETLKQEVTALTSNPGLGYLGTVVGDLFRGLTASKDAMVKACTGAAKAYEAFATTEGKYQTDRLALLDKISAAATNTAYTAQQQVAEADKLKKQLDAFDAQHQKRKDGTDKLSALCHKAEQQYDAQEKRLKAREKELREAIRRNLTSRPDQFALRLQQGWLRNEDANQGYTSAEAAYNTRRGWSFSVEGGVLYGEATIATQTRSVDEGQSPVGDNLRERSWHDETTNTSMKYNNFVQLGVDKAWKVGKTRKTSLQLGLSAGAYTGTETETVDSTRTSQLSDDNGALIGDAHRVDEVATTNKTLHDLVVGAGVELQRKFWGNLNVTLGGSVLYDTELNRTLPRLYLGAGASW